jgi:biotin carboxyl carrier protein
MALLGTDLTTRIAKRPTDAAERRPRCSGKGVLMAYEVHAELVANVLYVLVEAGDAVAEGDTLVLLESMKMEIPVPAEVSGTVAEIAVNEGDVVTEGDLIAQITEL